MADPTEARGVVETLEGLDESDIDVIIDVMEAEKDGAKKKKSKKEKKEGEEGEEEEEEEDESEFMKNLKKGLSLAAVVGRAERRRIFTWISSGPCTLQVLSFLCGVSIIVSGFVGIFIQTFNKFRIIAIMLNFYLMVFGLVISALEVKSQFCSVNVASRVVKWFHFLSTT